MPTELNEVNGLMGIANDTLSTLEEFVLNDLNGAGIAGERFMELMCQIWDPCQERQKPELYMDKMIRTYGVETLYETLGGEEPDDSTEKEKYDLVYLRAIPHIENVIDVLEFKHEMKKLSETAREENQRYADYVCSQEYDNLRVLQITMYEKELESTTDVRRKLELKRKIYYLKERFSVGFLYERLKDPKTKDNEYNNILESFFNGQRSMYLLEKFKEKCSQFGLSDDVHKYLLNIEENFLEEKYHVFNNFFLNMVMRYVGHCDSTSADSGKLVIQDMLNLNYHRFYSDEVREIFLQSIREFLDQFDSERDRFEKMNITHPKHPTRIQKNVERERALRKNIYEDIWKHGGDVDTDKLDAMDINELMKYHSNWKEELEKAKEITSPEYLIVSVSSDDSVEEGTLVNDDDPVS